MNMKHRHITIFQQHINTEENINFSLRILRKFMKYLQSYDFTSRIIYSVEIPKEKPYNQNNSKNA